MAKKQKSFAEKASSKGGKDLVYVKYVKSVQELVKTIKILSNHSKANNMGQRGLKYVNSLNDETFRIASTINTFL